MKHILLITALLTSMSAHALLKENFPTVKINDAMGSKSVSIKNFCLSDDERTLKSLGKMTICEEAKHVGRGYKECVSQARKQVVTPNKYLVSKCSGPRCPERIVSERSFPREINIDVIEWNPRGGAGKKVDEFTFALPYCLGNGVER